MSEISEKRSKRELPLEKPRKAIGREFLYSKANRQDWIDAAASKAYREVKDTVNIQKFADEIAWQIDNEACSVIFLGVGDSDSELKMLQAMQESGVRIHSVGVHEFADEDAVAETVKFRLRYYQPFAVSGDYSEIKINEVHSAGKNKRIAIMRGFHFANESDSAKMIAILKTLAINNGFIFVDFGIPMERDWRLEQSLKDGRGFSEREEIWYKKSFHDFLDYEFPQEKRAVVQVYSEAVSLGEENGISKGEAILVVGKDSTDQEFEINRYNRLNPEYIRWLFEQQGLTIVHGEPGKHDDTQFYSLLARSKG